MPPEQYYIHNKENIIRYVNRNKKLTTEYDEMQKQIRGEGYKYAFYAVLILEAVLCVLTMGIVLPAEPYVVHFFAIFVGITVQACYCIWRGAYIGQNTNLQRYVILMAIVSVFNLSSAFMAWRSGELIVLKAARAGLDMSQADLAEAVGVSRQTISAIEKGDYNPTINLCIKICKVLGKTLDELFWTEE